MIKSDKGNIFLDGEYSEIMADFICIMQMLIQEELVDKDFLHKIVDEFAMDSDQYMKQKMKQKIIDEIDKMDNIGDALNLLGQVLSDRRFK